MTKAKDQTQETSGPPALGVGQASSGYESIAAGGGQATRLKTETDAYISKLKIPFSDEQRAAIHPIKGTTAIIATAGAGKTATMSAAIACLIRIFLIPDDKILATTFTNAAADELKERIDGFAGRPTAINSGTMHHFCLGFIRKHYAKLGYAKSPTLIDERQRRTVITGILKDVMGAVNKKDGALITPADIERSLMWSEVLKFTNDAADVLSFSKGRSEIPRGIQEVIRRYELFMSARSYMDMDQILSLYLRLLTINYEERFLDLPDYIFIDEAQDLSAIQWLIVEQMAKTAISTTIIGDDDQSIYYFRGARPARFRKYADAAARKLFLSANRRCARTIVQLAKGVIDKMPKGRRIDKDLTAGRRDDGSVRLSAMASIHSMELVGRKILDEVKSGKKYSDFSIIARATTKIFPVVEGIFKELNIPYRIFGGRSAFDMPEVQLIKNMLAIYTSSGEALTERTADSLKTSLGDTASDLARLRHSGEAGGETGEDGINLQELMTGVGVSLGAAEKILTASDTKGGGLNAFAWSVHNSRIGATVKSNVMRFAYELSDARSRGNIRTMTLRELLARPVAASLLRSISEHSVLSVLRSKGKLPAGGNLKSLDEDTVDRLVYDREQKYSDLLSVYGDKTIVEVHDQFTLRGKQKDDEGSSFVTVTTCHSAKGLEWDTVFIAETNQGAWPSPMSTRGTKDAPPELLRDAKDEEHRLFYVAITRAKNNLFLLSTAIDFSTELGQEPTEFLPKKVAEKFSQIIRKTRLTLKSSGVEVVPEDLVEAPPPEKNRPSDKKSHQDEPP